jgi:hypothetical protein
MLRFGATLKPSHGPAHVVHEFSQPQPGHTSLLEYFLRQREATVSVKFVFLRTEFPKHGKRSKI